MKRAKKDLLSVEELKYYLQYDPITGEFTNAPRLVGGKLFISRKNATRTADDGYNYINVAGAQQRAANLAWLYMTGEYPPKGFIVDHKNTIRNDDSWDNLRLATQRQNSMNTSIRKNHSTGVKGVSAYSCGGGPVRYSAILQKDRKPIFHKSFDTLEEAAAAIKEAREKYHGEFANHG